MSATSATPVKPEHQAWALASLIAGQPVYRVGRWVHGRFQYPRPSVAPRITGSLPKGSAAVLVHGTDGSVATLCLDLDTSKAARSVVDTDATRLGAVLAECGLRYVEDLSPSGGRHIYVPLAERMPGADARELVEAMARLAASLDPGPHRNPVDGCIRVPGSLHRLGGHQQLVTPLSTAYDVLRRRNPSSSVAALRRFLAPELRRNREHAARRTALGDLGTSSTGLGPLGGSDSPLRTSARTGVYDTARYPSASEARMAVLTHLAACGWSLEQVRAELRGQFPGLASLYGPTERLTRLLPTEWAKASAWVQRNRRTTSTRKSDTSPPKPTGGKLSPAKVHQLVNDLENVLYAVLDERMRAMGREGLSLRLLLRALLGYMRTKETNILDIGCRTLAVALGRHHGTVARLLPRLCQASDGIVSKIADAHHKAADAYLIDLPEQYHQLARELSWRQGKIHGIRPVFRALGDPAALAYEAIERGRTAPTTAAVVRAAGISRTAAETALDDMQALGMIHCRNHHWYTTSVNLSQLAIRLGVADDVALQINVHRRQRAAWHAYLDRHTAPAVYEEDLYDNELDEYWLPPDDTAMYGIWAAA